jgi:P-type Ca2+ transporter type 2B
MTNVFNVFVILQIFNLINARKINDEKNILDNVFSNSTYCVILLIIFGGQALIVEFGSRALKVSPYGLHWSHWVIAIILGFTTWGANFLIKLVPDEWCPQFGKKKKNPLDDEPNVLGLRRNRTQSFSLRQPSNVVKEGSGK